MARIERGSRLLFLCLLAFGSQFVFAQEVVRPRAANPHGALQTPCENCHTTTAWRPLRVQPEFNHDTQTSFPLRGLHQGVECRNCHTSMVFSKASTRCADCHADVHRRQFGANCQECHTVRGWNVAVSAIQQHTNRFPLLGAHAAATCDQCHMGAASGVYTGLSTDCVSCHLKDYQTATPLSHLASKLPTTCEMCHSVDRWQGARFDHAQFAQYPLVGAHAQLDCASCHIGGRYQGTPADCFGCHATDFNKAQPDHKAAAFPHDCSVCHSTTTWAGAVFDHATTGFTLTGAHVSVGCADCHVAGRFAGTPTQCIGCHQADFDKTSNPNHHQAGISTTCETCHTTANWQNAKFDHTLSSFPLTGAHLTVPCEQCHLNGNFTTAATQCSGCHLTDFKNALNPNHVAAGFPQDCSICHTTVQWQGAQFDHNAATKFPLTGAHTKVDCAQCHANNVFAGTATQCVGCHLTDFNSANNPPHATGGLPQDCTMCHTTTQWTGAKFDHTASTKFPLTGAHATVPCAQCHVNAVFAGLTMQCVGCHMTDFNGAKSPNHVAAGFSQDCQVCHSTVGWQPAQFDHSRTQFPLTGAHVALACDQCHKNGQTSALPTACVSCHLTDFKNANDPNHVAAGFPQDCQVCHATVNWLNAQFDHNATRFPLTGAHLTVACLQCHTNNVFAGTQTQCFSCHLNDWKSANNPNHITAGFPQDCSVCHTTIQWMGAKFDHTAMTKFPLTGAHATLACSQCHANGVFAGTQTACIACHLTDFKNTTNPNHVTAGFQQECQFCHSTTNWLGAVFNHNATPFPLTGAHATVTCAQCHVNNVFAGTTTACSGCHLNDYNTATNPNHKTSGFPMACETCHNTANWTNATFDHAMTGFPLTGGHVTAQCVQCHVSNNFNLTSGACAQCHMTDYNGAANPNHKAAAFPTTCDSCHTTAPGWGGASFNHASTGFALTGAHTNTPCVQCHANGNYSLTSGACGACHMTDYNNTTNPAHKAAAFPTTCDSCHTTAAGWGGATFNHASTGFALTGAHTNTPCAQCHVNGNYSLTTTACAQCHMTDYNNTTNPAHKAAAFPTTCDSCHTTAAGWGGATFNHASTGFALTGAHTNTPCAQCHVNGNYSLTTAACADCHMTDYNNTTNPAHKAAAFPTTCDSCHTTVAGWGGATFNHTSTGFALTGAHTSLQCAQCHNSTFGNYSISSGACANCHMADYNGTTNPSHTAAAFPTTCDTCHTTVAGWGGATFNHTTTGFALTGAHTTLQCTQCHNSTFGNYSISSGACANCHMADYNGTTNPNHKTAAFPTDCSGCHTTVAGWGGATFNHAATGFALTGSHATLQCVQCHVNSNYSLTSANALCANCHMADYNGTNNPVHSAAGFPTTCDTCHTTTDWTGATFTHPTTPIAIVNNAHSTVACTACHINNVFTNTPTDCYSCHKTDYTNTTNPAHAAAGFPTTCATCHQIVAGWAGATFNHTQFPITSGTHNQSVWVTCNTCHTNASDYSVFTCINCHTHVQTTVDKQHGGVRNYVYSATSCYSCHPRGNGG